MTLDLVLLGLVLLAAVAGAMSGALWQVLKLAGVVAGWAAARWLAPRVVQQLQDPSAATRALVVAGAFVAAWMVVAMLARAIRRAVQGEEEEPGGLDRALGAVLGAAKGALVAWVFLSLLALMGGRLALGPLRVESRGSRAAAWRPATTCWRWPARRRRGRPSGWRSSGGIRPSGSGCCVTRAGAGCWRSRA